MTFDTPVVDLRVLEIPPISDRDANAPGVYIFASLTHQGSTQAFRPIDIYKSYDGFTTYTFVGTITVPSVSGFGLAALASGPIAWKDQGGSLQVFLYGTGGFSGSTDDYVLGPERANLIWVDGELIHFTDATQVEAQAWTLSGLYRGQYGTEAANVDHEEAFPVMLIDRVAGLFVPLEGSEIGQEIRFRGVLSGADPTETSLTEQTLSAFAATNMKPLDPVAPSVDRTDAAAITFRWNRRMRLSIQAIGQQTEPLDEPREEYEVLLYDGPGGSLLHTFTVQDQASLDYTAASSGLGLPSPTAVLTFKVRQLGRWSTSELSAEVTG